jgi:hypothetical protein
LRIYEITNPEDQLALLRMIMDNTWAAISRQRQSKIPITKPNVVISPSKAIKTKPASKPKKVPYAAAPKPLPKPKPLSPPPLQLRNQQQKVLPKAPAKSMPKSLQPLPTNIISPIGGGDPELNKKLDQARRQGEQNRASGSEPHSFNKI